MQVDVFLTTSAHSPGRVRKGQYKYILVCNGHTLEGKGELDNATGNQLALVCAIEALKRMARPSVITIHTDSHYLIDGNEKLLKRRDAGWRREDGKELKNLSLWQQLYSLQKNHAARYHFECMDMYK